MDVDKPIRWILDDGPFGALAKRVPLACAVDWPHELFFVPEATARAVENDHSGRRQAWLARAALAEPPDEARIEDEPSDDA